MSRSVLLTSSSVALALLLVLAVPSGASAAELPALPDPIMTPGAIDPAATLGVICNGTTRERRHVSAAEKAEVLAAYNIPLGQAAYYEIDHLVPLAIGGANVVSNLWPQPWAEADEKDILEVELQRRVCHGVLGQAEAQREVADDWIATYRGYVGDRLVAVGEPAQAIPEQHRRKGITERLKAGVRRLYRSWILGSE